MKKWVIILLIVALSSGLYLYYNNNWQQKLDQLAQFEEQMNQPLKAEKNIEVELDDETSEKTAEIPIVSPFKSELKLQELQKKAVEDQPKPDLAQKENKEVPKVENKRPPLKLLGILRTDQRSLVTMIAAKEIKRLTVGEQIGRFELVEINKNNVVLKSDENSFTFWLGSRPQGEEKINQAQGQGGNQN